MSELEARFQRLRTQIESAAFLVARGGSERDAHSELLRALITLAKIEGACSLRKANEVNPAQADVEIEEVAKVEARLRRWARPDRQHQINARILNAFLRLERSGAAVISKEDLRRELPDVESFDSNFAQMTTISERNHGKVFHQDGTGIKIWGPVMHLVREYERALEFLPSDLESHKILSVKVVQGDELNGHWKMSMQVITTDRGEYIDNMPGIRLGVPGFAKAGFDWASMNGERVDGVKVFSLSGYRWLNKQ